MTVQVKKICLTQKLLAELKSTTQQFRRTADEKFKIEVESYLCEEKSPWTHRIRC